MVSAVGAIGSAVVGGMFSNSASKQQVAAADQAARYSAAGAIHGREALEAQFQPSLADLQQGYTGAQQALQQQTPAAQQQMALEGVLGQEAQQAAINEFIQSPGQQFLRDEQERALLRNTGAIGGLGGGNVRSALQEQAFGRAATMQQQRFANLGQIAGQEQQQQANLANLFQSRGQALSGLRSSLGTNLANISIGQGAQQAQFAQNIGQAKAAGQLGIGSAIQQGIGGLANVYGQNVSDKGGFQFDWRQ